MTVEIVITKALDTCMSEDKEKEIGNVFSLVYESKVKEQAHILVQELKSSIV